MKAKFVGVLAGLMTLGLVAVGCAQTPVVDPTQAPTQQAAADPTQTPSADPTQAGGTDYASLSGQINIAGSTSIQELAEQLGEAFGEVTSGGVLVNVQGGGSGAGVTSATDGVADIGTVSRELKDDEKGGLNEYTIAVDAIALVVNPNNTVENLTSEQVTAIFKGEIANWSEVGGPDAPITVINREAGSGTRGAFGELLELEKDGEYSYFTADAVTFDSTGKVKAEVAKNESAIGYISLGSVDDTVKDVQLDGKQPTIENIKTGDYALQRPFLMVTNKANESELGKAFIDWALSDEGQGIVGEKYIKVTDLK